MKMVISLFLCVRELFFQGVQCFCTPYFSFCFIFLFVSKVLLYVSKVLLFVSYLLIMAISIGSFIAGSFGSVAFLCVCLCA